jgi:hypothetical protein
MFCVKQSLRYNRLYLAMIFKGVALKIVFLPLKQMIIARRLITAVYGMFQGFLVTKLYVM